MGIGLDVYRAGAILYAVEEDVETADKMIAMKINT